MTSRVPPRQSARLSELFKTHSTLLSRPHSTLPQRPGVSTRAPDDFVKSSLPFHKLSRGPYSLSLAPTRGDSRSATALVVPKP